MRIGNRELMGANEEIIVIPRGDSEPIVFKARAVVDMSGFDALCPLPKPPTKILKGGKRVEDVESRQFQYEVNEYSQKKVHYIVLKSLEATEGLEWDTVNMSDNTTWGNYLKDLKRAEFSEVEITKIVKGVLTANCLNEEILDKARADFLASQRAEQAE